MNHGAGALSCEHRRAPDLLHAFVARLGQDAQLLIVIKPGCNASSTFATYVRIAVEQRLATFETRTRMRQFPLASTQTAFATVRTVGWRSTQNR
jgi:hypothetical protein